jgi:hypothetical protein
MKKISFIIIHLVVINVAFCQEYYSLLKEVTLNLPDSVYFRSGYENSVIVKVWKDFNNNPLNHKELYTTILNRGYNYKYLELKSNGECCKNSFLYNIDVKNGLFKLNRDTQLQIKNFKVGEQLIVGVSVSGINGFANPEIIFTAFYKYENGNFTDYTDEVFKGFNFATDNYSKETVDWLNKHYQRNRYKEPLPKFLIYTFTPSDTIYIFEDFYDFSCCEDGNFYLDKDHMLQALFWRAYVFKDCKLNPVGDVKKEKWDGKSLFE